jgi:hypothetical protein
MPLFILRLEDRILFDAAAPAVIAQAVEAASNSQPANQADPAPQQSTETQQGTDHSTDQSAQPDHASDHQPAAPPLVEALSTYQDNQVTLLLVASNVDNAQQLADAAANDVITVVYDYNNTSLDQLQQMITDALGGQKADTISFATEGQGGFIYLLKDLYVTADTLAADADLAHFWKQVGEQLAENGRVDLLGCFIGGENGEDFGLLSQLDSLIDTDGNNHTIAASTDLTGNLRNGNWLLEVGNIQADSYFNIDKLAAWSGEFATFTVTNTANSGAGSLRTAISNANSSSGIDTINFNISASSTISITSLLSSTGPIILDGTTATGYSLWSNMVTIERSSNAQLLNLEGSGNIIRGLQFSMAGFTLSSSSGSSLIVLESGSLTFQNNHVSDTYGGLSITGGSATVIGNRIGTDITGTTSNNNMALGIFVTGGSATVGGMTLADRNIIAGIVNMVRYDSGTTGDVYNNYIGVDVTGTVDLTSIGPSIHPLGSKGIILNGANGTIDVQGNVISGTDRGIWVLNSTTTGTLNIIGNMIGTNAAGTAALGNGVGIILEGSNTVNIGTTAVADRNIISGNTTGIQVNGAPSTLTIRNNYIGTDVNGSSAIGNTTGILVNTSTLFTIGGNAANQGNVISGNTVGIAITGGTGPNIYGNKIGVAADGVSALGNTSHGINITGGSGTTVGGTSAGQPNIIAYNGDVGVRVQSSTGNDIRQNSIYENTGLGIDLVSGGNSNQAAPTLTSVTYNSVTNQLTITGSFTGTSGQTYALEFFANQINEPEGRDYLGVLALTSTGTNTFSFVMTGLPPSGSIAYAATATRNSNSNTSEFSNTVQNNSPVVDLNGAVAGSDVTRTFTEDGGAINIAPAATVTDSDSTNLASMTVTLTNRPNGTSESLSFTPTGGITGSYNSSNGVLTLTGGSSVAVVDVVEGCA